jgi:hypothetical protein
MCKLLRGLLIAALVGCASTPAQQQSLWGRIHTLTETEQSHAPAIWVQPEGALTAAWIGADDIGVHQDTRKMLGAQMGDTITLPLPPVHPHAQMLLPAGDDRLHLLWQDTNNNGEQRLYAALLTPELSVERGPTVISDRLTLRYTAVPQANGQIVTVWSGGLPAEPVLYLQRIDERGLPHAPVLLAHDADWPALAQANNGTLFLFWRQPSYSHVYGGQLQGNTLINLEDVRLAISHEPGSLLHQFYAALDSTYLYLFLNMTLAAGENQAWVTTRPLNTAEWSVPNLIGVGDAQEDALQTGFNTGTVSSAVVGEDQLAWAAPMPGQFDVLPVAGRIGDDLAVVYFQAGAIAGYQRIVPVRALIGPPLLLPDRDRYLYLAWAEPLESGRAALKLTSSRG